MQNGLTIGVVTMWYNEEILAPLFLDHYSYAEEIYILLDVDTDDNTRALCDRSNVVIEPFMFPDGFDDLIKQEKINRVVARKDYDWVIAVDADEFVFPPGLESPWAFLVRQEGNVVYADMWKVYRHKTDFDIDPNKPAIWQRQHGDPSFEGYNKFEMKPIVVRPQTGIYWNVGCHSIYTSRQEMRVCMERFQGAHWHNADPDLAVKRRLASKERQSPANLQHGHQSHNHNITEEQIRALCKDHEKDPLLFQLPASIEQPYDLRCTQKTDINEHLPILREYAGRVDHVTEFGVRDGNSTVALACGRPTKMVSYDIEEMDAVLSGLISKEINFTFVQADVCDINIEPTDLLFLDTLHTYAQLCRELSLHGHKVQKYLIFHDTQTYGEIGEDGSRPGLRQAIREYMVATGCWSIQQEFTNNNGLTILHRDSTQEGKGVGGY